MLETSRKLFVHYRGCHKKSISFAAARKLSVSSHLMKPSCDRSSCIVAFGSTSSSLWWRLGQLDWSIWPIYVYTHQLPLYDPSLKLLYVSSENFHARKDMWTDIRICSMHTSTTQCHLSFLFIYCNVESGVTSLAWDLILIYLEIMHHTGFPIVFFFYIKI